MSNYYSYSMQDEVYQAFMNGYVRRINAATFNVVIGGVRIGYAKRSRLAQINLASRIITFSRYAIENVPERGRRYLVIHELAHVHEAGHTKRFWQLVGNYEPNYKSIDRELQVAFQKNVRALRADSNNLTSRQGSIESANIVVPKHTGLINVVSSADSSDFHWDDSVVDNCCDEVEDEFGAWSAPVAGLMSGG